MRRLLYYLLFGAINSLALAAPQAQLFQASQTLLSPQETLPPEPGLGDDPANAGVQCDQGHVYHPLIWSHCEVAIGRLPRDLPGDVYWDPKTRKEHYPTFKRSNSDYPHDQLPQIQRYGNCAASVKFINGASMDTNSWVLIRRWFGTIGRICINTMGGDGGTAIMGALGRMEASLEFTLGENATLLRASEQQ
ncbi:MAG: hypothetical protein Q9167_007925 [Letrouitia subvulpina]